MRHIFLLSLAICTALTGCTAHATDWVGTGIPSAHYNVTRHIDWTVQTPVDMKAGGDGAYSIGGMDWTATTTAQCSEMSVSASGLTIATTAVLKGLPQLIAAILRMSNSLNAPSSIWQNGTLAPRRGARFFGNSSISPEVGALAVVPATAGPPPRLQVGVPWL